MTTSIPSAALCEGSAVKKLSPSGTHIFIKLSTFPGLIFLSNISEYAKLWQEGDCGGTALGGIFGGTRPFWAAPAKVTAKLRKRSVRNDGFVEMIILLQPVKF
jgi:hypothetical protein